MLNLSALTAAGVGKRPAGKDCGYGNHCNGEDLCGSGMKIVLFCNLLAESTQEHD